MVRARKLKVVPLGVSSLRQWASYPDEYYRKEWKISGQHSWLNLSIRSHTLKSDHTLLWLLNPCVNVAKTADWVYPKAHSAGLAQGCHCSFLCAIAKTATFRQKFDVRKTWWASHYAFLPYICQSLLLNLIYECRECRVLIPVCIVVFCASL